MKAFLVKSVGLTFERERIDAFNSETIIWKKEKKIMVSNVSVKISIKSQKLYFEEKLLDLAKSNSKRLQKTCSYKRAQLNDLHSSQQGGKQIVLG